MMRSKLRVVGSSLTWALLLAVSGSHAQEVERTEPVEARQSEEPETSDAEKSPEAEPVAEVAAVKSEEIEKTPEGQAAAPPAEAVAAERVEAEKVSEGQATAPAAAACDDDGAGALNASVRECFDPAGLWLGEVLMVPQLQYRLRYRHDEGHDFLDNAAQDSLRHRARLGLTASWKQRLTISVQLQDVRTFGEEIHPTQDYSADGFDAHQAFLSVKPYRNLDVRLGRQNIALANERLVGKRDWLEQGQSFDAVRFVYDRKTLRFDSFIAQVRSLPSELALGNDHVLGGALAAYRMMPEFHASVMGLLDREQGSGKRLATVGALFDGQIKDMFRYGLEAYYQFGKSYGDVSHSAFLVSANAGVTFDVRTQPYIEATGSFVSGDDTPTDKVVEVFEAPFGSKHQFHGKMDMFTNLAADTGGRGLMDLSGALGATPVENLSLRLEHHVFQAMASSDGSRHYFGHELDMSARYQFWKQLGVSVGSGVFFPGDIIEQSIPAAASEQFSYITIDARL